MHIPYSMVLHIIRADILRVAYYFSEPEGAMKNTSNDIFPLIVSVEEKFVFEI